MLNPESLRQSFRIASRKPGTLEVWVFENVPRLLAEVERLYAELAKEKTSTNRRKTEASQ